MQKTKSPKLSLFISHPYDAWDEKRKDSPILRAEKPSDPAQDAPARVGIPGRSPE